MLRLDTVRSLLPGKSCCYILDYATKFPVFLRWAQCLFQYLGVIKLVRTLALAIGSGPMLTLRHRDGYLVVLIERNYDEVFSVKVNDFAFPVARSRCKEFLQSPEQKHLLTESQNGLMRLKRTSSLSLSL